MTRKAQSDVRFDPAVAVFPGTYITATTTLTLKVYNNTKRTVKYRWAKYSSCEEEREVLDGVDLYDPDVRRKYERILDFRSDSFVIEQMSGEIWAERFQYFTFTFTPNGVDDFEEKAYLLDAETGKRYCLTLQGKGLPPEARFSADKINVGHVSLDAVCVYDLVLSNQGAVDIDFDVDCGEKNGLIVNFRPNKGHVPVGESLNMKVEFVASRVGAFKEKFPFNIRGAANFKPTITLFGKIFGPEFVVSPKFLNYRDLSYGFLYVQEFEIENKSDIPFDFAVRPLQDNTFSPREFNVVPAEGTIEKYGRQTVQIEFVPISVQKYEVKFAVDVLKVGQALEIVTVTANSLRPNLRLLSNTIDFGRVFIGRQYTKDVTVVDDSDFPAKFDFVLPPDSAVSQALVSAPKVRGVVNRQEQLPMKLSILPQVLGPIKMTAHVRAYGSESPLIPFTITALCVGPNIVLSTQSVNFGNVRVLSHANDKIVMKNDSLIPAVFTASIQSETGVFSVEPDHGEMAPGDSLPLTVTASIDDATTFTGKVVIVFQNLNPIYVDLAAKGQGNPIVSSVPMNVIDFDYILNQQTIVKTFTVTNHGRRPQELRWSQQKPKGEDNTELPFKISMSPEQAVIEPRSSVTFQLSAYSDAPCSFTTLFQCHATLGRSRSDLWKTTVKGVVIKPVLSFSTNFLEFVHRHDPEQEEKLASKLSKPSAQLMPSQSKRLMVKNLTKLPLDVNVEFVQPFTLSPAVFTLSSEEDLDLDVTFHADFKEDFCTEVLNRRLVFSFKDHPQKLYVNLRGSFIFPNLSFSEPMNMNFGNLMINTENTKEVKMTVSSDMDVEWKWQLLSDDPTCDIGRIFDVFPIRGKLESGQSDEVHFSFFAVAGEDGNSKTYSATAICHVTGGPDYVVNLSGGAAAINYQISPTEIDFGAKMYDEKVSRHIKVSNMSDVPITYAVKIPKGAKFAHFMVTPTEGTIPVEGTADLHVVVIGGIPQDFSEYFVLQIGHFEEKKVSVHLNCHFPQISMNLPRTETDPATQMMPDATDYPDAERKLIIEKLQARQIIPSSGVSSRKRKDIAAKRFTGFIMAEYLLETGPITVGDVKEIGFELTSCTPFPISFELVGDVLLGTGFSVEPAAADAIPQGSKLPMKVIFDTAQRVLNTDGIMEWDLTFKLTNDLGFVVRLKTEMVLPVLTLSKKMFDFGEVIVGQRKVYTLQLQNANAVPCEFSFGALEIQSQPPRPAKYQGDEPTIFQATPTDSVIRPGSFQNVEIAFAPLSGGEYLMELPLSIRYNLQPIIIGLSGRGVQMKLLFDPPIANCPPVQPFSDPSQLQVKMINPSNYPVEVFSYQFDFDLFCNSLRRKIETSVDENVICSQDVSHFSVCVIVHGPNMSGCTTVSQIVSKHLGGLPVISLKDVWGELLQSGGASAADYTAKFFERISASDCGDGFVVDSLNIFPDGKDADQFILSCLKAKNCYEETVKNPFNAISHQNVISVEVALNYLLAALDGQFVFFIGVRTNLDLVYSRIDKQKSDEKQRKKDEYMNEKNTLFNMTEEEYQALSEEEREEIDRRRKDFRTRMVNTPDFEDGDGRGSRRNMRRKKDEKAGDTRHRKNDDPPKRRNKVPTDPHDREILLFDLIVGSLAKAVNEGKDNFQTFDPILAKRRICSSVTEEEEDQGSKNYIQQKNAIILNPDCTLEDLDETVTEFIPNVQLIREVRFAEMIPEEKVENSKLQVAPVSKYKDAPQFFSIVNGESNADGNDTSRVGGNGEEEEETSGDFDVSRLTTRWSIEPNGSETITVRFTAGAIGQYKGQLLFGISNCTCDPIRLPCVGVCGQPNIERKVKAIFDKVVPKSNWKTERAFAMDKQEFVFGPSLISKEKLGKNQLPPYIETIHLTNPTLFPAKVSMAFSKSTCQWVVEPATVTIPPGESADVKVGVNPTIPDMHKAVLSFFVADQPDPYHLNFSCDCCVPAIDIPNPVLDFGKLLLQQSRVLQLDFKNTGKLPVFWRLKNTNGCEPSISFDATEGTIGPKRSFTLHASFTSEKQHAIKKSINIDVMDKNQSRVYESPSVPVSAEAFDVLFDFQYPKGLDHLQFGTLNVQQTKTLTCTLKNKGKFQLKFKIAYLDKLFKVHPSEGALNPNDKALPINFTVNPPKVLRYKNAKGISMHIMDPLTGTTTAILPIPFSCESLYSQFSILPGRDIDFGPVPITTAITKQFTIQNDGCFPFEFELVGSNAPEPAAVPALTNDKKGRASPAKTRGKKSGAPIGAVVQVSSFMLTPATGCLQPGASVSIDTSFQSPNPGQQNTTVFLKITDSDPSKRGSDMTVKLRANNISPGIVTHKFDKIFPNLDMCLRYDVTKQEKTAFLEDEQVLHFEPVILQQKRQVEVVLINPKPVTCVVDLSIKPKAKGPASLPFEISEKSVSLEPNSSRTVRLTFRPTVGDSYVGLFEGAVRTGVSSDKLLKFAVEGIGTLPAVRIVGLDMGKPNSYTSYLGRTLIGFTKEKVISLINDGVIDAHVKMTFKGGGDLYVVDQKAFQSFVVPPGNTVNITLMFKPTNSKKNTLEMTVNIADNPKATAQLSVVAEGSSDDVVFEGLASDDGDIFFRNCIVGRPEQATFRLKNVGVQNCRFTFTQQPNITLVPRVGHIHAGQSKQITVSVLSDHPIKQTVMKIGCQITKIELENPDAPDWDDSMKVVKFVEKEAIKMEPPVAPETPKKRRNPPLKKALPPLQSPAPLEVPESKESDKPVEPEFVRVVEVKEEPRNTILPGKAQDLPMRATVVVDNIRYAIDTSEITFSPTMMYQTRVMDCKMTNTSQVRLEYCWKVSNFESLRTDYARTRAPPFSVEPTSGFIEPGTATLFRVKFSPEEVDDFTAELECSIPFLSQQAPPLIRVAGLSRRPLCHFNVNLSDYLRRRYPDYTAPLPEGVRVIELSSSAVGRKTHRRFDIMNPTASPYEITWRYAGTEPTPQIVCEAQTGLVSSNRRYTVTFSYTPRSAKPVESLWEFQIPEHSMSVYFLFVGRIVPK